MELEPSVQRLAFEFETFVTNPGNESQDDHQALTSNASVPPQTALRLV
jgi:hypothetical protein